MSTFDVGDAVEVRDYVNENWFDASIVAHNNNRVWRPLVLQCSQRRCTQPRRFQDEHCLMYRVGRGGRDGGGHVGGGRDGGGCVGGGHFGGGHVGGGGVGGGHVGGGRVGVRHVWFRVGSGNGGVANIGGRPVRIVGGRGGVVLMQD
eukprot:6251950-Ditylum_brightwellii.AAC.1